MITRIFYTRFAFWLFVISDLIGISSEAISEELDAEARAEWRQLFDQVAADYSLVRQSDRQRLELVDRAVYTWSRSGADGGSYGNVYVWTDRGNAESVACFWRSPNNDGTISIAHELHSLSTDILVPEGMDSHSWVPKAGLKRIVIENAPRPDASAVVRMQQMQAICHDLSARSVSSRDERTELRLLPKPLYRYRSTNPDVIDGALFAFVCSVGTDPEVFVQLEAINLSDGPRWHFTAARFSHMDLFLDYREKEIWRAVRDDFNPISNNADNTYWLFHKSNVGTKLRELNKK